MTLLTGAISKSRLALLAALLSCQSLWANDRVTWLIQDQHGTAIGDAVVVLHARDRVDSPRTESIAVMDQIKRQFHPHVLAIQVNTRVSFPNSDDILHHVYSFSTPKPFELELYQGKPSGTILFDKPGEVVLGCNIHDQMLGYIYVVDSPWFAVANQQGEAVIAAVPEADYQVHVWHPRAAQVVEAGALRVSAESQQAEPYLVTIPLTKPAPNLDDADAGLFKPSGFKARYRN